MIIDVFIKLVNKFVFKKNRKFRNKAVKKYIYSLKFRMIFVKYNGFVKIKCFCVASTRIYFFIRPHKSDQNMKSPIAHKNNYSETFFLIIKATEQCA